MRPERVEINRGRQRQPGPSIRRLLLRRAPLEQRPLVAHPDVLLDRAKHIALVKVRSELRARAVLSELLCPPGDARPAAPIRHHPILRTEDVEAIPCEKDDGETRKDWQLMKDGSGHRRLDDRTDWLLSREGKRAAQCDERVVARGDWMALVEERKAVLAGQCTGCPRRAAALRSRDEQHFMICERDGSPAGSGAVKRIDALDQ